MLSSWRCFLPAMMDCLKRSSINVTLEIESSFPKQTKTFMEACGHGRDNSSPTSLCKFQLIWQGLMDSHPVDGGLSKTISINLEKKSSIAKQNKTTFIEAFVYRESNNPCPMSRNNMQ